MKKYWFVTVLMLVVSAAATFASNTPKQQPLPQPRTASDGGPIAMCRPGVPCDPLTGLKQVASDGGPIAFCRPGVPCDPVTAAKALGVA